MPPRQIQSFEDFKELVHRCSIKTLHCLFNTKVTPSNQEKPPVGMKLYFYINGDDNYLMDYASDTKLKLTGIPVRVYGSRKEPYIAEEDVKTFINKEFPGITVSFDFEI